MTGKATPVAAVIAAVVGAAAAVAAANRCPLSGDGQHSERYVDGDRPCAHCGASPR